MNETILLWKKTQDALKAIHNITYIEIWQSELNYDVPNLCDLKVPIDLKLIGGLDISFDKVNDDLACVCMAVVDSKSNKLIAKHSKIITMTEPYIANYLAFRECEHMVDIVREYLNLYPNYKPQVLLVDGNGTCHSNRFGSACHLGVRLQQEGILLPTIGVAKKYLHVDGMPTRADIISKLLANVDKGSELLFEVVHPETAERLCMVRRQPRKKKELNKEELGKLSFISPGHSISFTCATNVVRLCSKCRMPEPILLADHYAKDFLIKHNITNRNSQGIADSSAL